MKSLSIALALIIGIGVTASYAEFQEGYPAANAPVASGQLRENLDQLWQFSMKNFNPGTITNKSLSYTGGKVCFGNNIYTIAGGTIDFASFNDGDIAYVSIIESGASAILSADTGSYNLQGIPLWTITVNASDVTLASDDRTWAINGNNGLIDGSVTTDKIADGAVTTTKIADSSVTSTKIADGAIQTSKLTDSSVTTAKIAAGAVAASNIADNAIATNKITDGAVTTSKIADGTVTASKIASGVISDALPVGTVFAFAGSTPPTGYLECDGSEVSRSTYASLFAVIGSTYGSGDGSVTFNLPDYRGEFLRGWDHGRGADPDAAARTGGDAVGSKQSGQIESHNHRRLTNPGGSSGGSGRWWGSSGNDNGTYPDYVEDTGGNETRPRNVGVMYCIKY